MKSYLFQKTPEFAYEIQDIELRRSKIPTFDLWCETKPTRSNKPCRCESGETYTSCCYQPDWWKHHDKLYLGGSANSPQWKQMARQAKINDGYRCVKCGSSEKLETDHVVPLSKGGENDFSNLQTLCHDCHEKKSKRKFSSFS